MRLPRARGPLSAEVLARLSAARPAAGGPLDVPESPDPVHDEDLQLTLWVLYELHYRSFDDLGDDWEWDAGLLAAREALERQFETALRTRLGHHVAAAMSTPGDVASRLFAVTESFEGPALAAHVQRRASREQVVELLLHKSVYQLKEADAYTWVVPRLEPDIKAQLMELQFDEYGDGHPERVHQALYATTLRGAGLDPTYGAYVDDVPAITLAMSNAVSMLGLHRRLRAAALGHLAAVEATSSLPCRRLAAGIRRVGFGDDVAHFFDEHVEADAVHEQLAIRGICGSLVEASPESEADVVFGAVVSLDLDAQFASRLLAAWDADERLTSGVPALGRS